ncbi:xanthosine triphosphate pyrophosphatase [Fructobacillus sp. M1-13]|uniref:Xanthosine triphosphate pyrophosphatase n=1 Tax=Fructobacillus papyriferae TaxID=2713171 RepID=A0ABS5QQU0_9LACO|nr:non-canonical purine NTP pyrophosphatase [Fructobacillus papyriferae]MBS9334771.1 xanthosine triphosphate pyrophosphatase [Fructobacillus papyriferae]MCD2158761.1 xanthosine triphosphate pyrophosphatase [Fructobacillus papyriferae]
MRIVLASNNEEKTRELTKLAALQGQEIVSYRAILGEKLSFPAESEDDQEQNARTKAAFIHDKLPKEWVLADDTAFFLEAFPERFGVKAAREFKALGLKGVDQENAYLLDLYKDLADEKRGAYLLSTMALITPDGQTYVASARGGVAIAKEPVGGPDLAGLTDLLLAENGKTMSSMPLAEAADYHDRSRTLRALLAQVEQDQ